DTANASGAQLRVVFHVQNDGVGFRYEIPQQASLPATAKMTQEYTAFRITSGARAWLQRQALPGSYEGGFAAGTAGTDARVVPRPRGPGWTRDKPALDAFVFPMLFAPPSASPLYVLVTEAARNGNYAAMRVAGTVRDGLYTFDFPTDEEPARAEFREGPGR